MAKKQLARSKKRLIQEAETLLSLDHPSIIKAYELVPDSEQTVIFLEYISGKNLFENLYNIEFSSLDVIANLMEQLLTALVYLHGKGIIHKDVKLENIVIEEAVFPLSLKLIDFGYSEIHAESTRKNSSGTMYYMAPEVYQMQYDQKADIWSAGIVLYSLLFQKLLFKGNNSVEIAEDVLKKDLNSVFEKRQQQLSDQFLIPFLQKLLEKDPQKRYSAAEALNDPFIQAYRKRKPFLTYNLGSQSSQRKTFLELIFSYIYAHHIFTPLQKCYFGQAFLKLQQNNEEDIHSQMELVFSDFEKSTVKVKDMSFTHFMAKFVDLNAQKDQVQKLFTFLDLDNDGYVELKAIMAILDFFVDTTLLNKIRKRLTELKCHKVRIFLL